MFIGRPVLWGLAHGGEEGVARVLTLLNDEFTMAMKLVGAVSVKVRKYSNCYSSCECIYRSVFFVCNVVIVVTSMSSVSTCRSLQSLLLPWYICDVNTLYFQISGSQTQPCAHGTQLPTEQTLDFRFRFNQCFILSRTKVFV